MDYLKAKQYLLDLPLPVFFVSIKSGRIIFANSQAGKIGLEIEASFFQMLDGRGDFSRLVKDDDINIQNGKKLKLRINKKSFTVNVSVSKANYGNIYCLLITITSIDETVKQDETVTISKICDIFTGQTGNKESYDFLRLTAESTGAFCAAIYEKRNSRYVIKEEWRERKSVCIPLLYTDFEKHTAAEVRRLAKLKRAVDTAHAAYKKNFGTLGIIVYFFDQNISAKQRKSLEKFINIYRVLCKDVPKNNRLIAAKKGINSLSQAFAVWEPATRKLLFENKAYRAMFGYKNAHELNESLGKNIVRSSVKTQSEDYTDAKGRYYSALHTRARMSGKEIIVTAVTDITKFKEAENKLDMMASTDALTGLLNRRAGIEYLRQIYTKSKAEKKALTVCFADIDGLKYINDTYGHGAGDSMIKSVAAVLKEHAEKIGAVYRLGGDEFVLILPGFNRGQAAQLAVQIGKAAAKCLVGESQGISMSFGFKEAEYKPSETAGSLISTADSEMYQEKRKKSAKRTI